MFDELKKKISNTIKSFVKREEKQQIQQPIDQPIPDIKTPEIEHSQIDTHLNDQPIPIVKEQKKEHTAIEKKSYQPMQHIESKQAIKVSLKTKIKSIISNKVNLSQKEIDEFAASLETSMLSADVSYETTEYFIKHLKKVLLDSKIDSHHISHDVLMQVRASLFDVLKTDKHIDVLSIIKSKRSQSLTTPVKILFLGPNGAGKTTTIAKLAHILKKNGLSAVMSASDTFRAAAIEQTEQHAKRIGVPVIKSKYGADPSSVAFDAIAYAKAHSIAVVLIDSAGRQETNKNLINEMKKIVRVTQPDITVFVGESIAGNFIAEQIKEFSNNIKIDGIILTKLDADSKGGNAISITHTTGIPILFFGTGESYDALVPYSAEFIVDNIVPIDKQNN